VENWKEAFWWSATGLREPEPVTGQFELISYLSFGGMQGQMFN
jgi:hypothetical protein